MKAGYKNNKSNSAIFLTTSQQWSRIKDFYFILWLVSRREGGGWTARIAIAQQKLECFFFICHTWKGAESFKPKLTFLKTGHFILGLGWKTGFRAIAIRAVEHFPFQVLISNLIEICILLIHCIILKTAILRKKLFF